MAAGRLLLLLLVELSAISESKGQPSIQNCGVGEYLYQGYCCKYCRAGTYVVDHCKVPHTEGICYHCTDGEDYTAHANGLDECIRCKLCKEDQIIVSTCTSTRDTECQCKPGYFCPPQGCEMCHRCKPKCPEGKEIVQKCNATVDLECDHPPNGSANAAGWIFGIFVFVSFMVGCFLIKKMASYNKTNKENKDRENDVESENSTEIFFVPEIENANTSTPILEIQNSVQSPTVNSSDSALRKESPENTSVAVSERSSLLLNDENNFCEECYHKAARYSAPVKPPDKPNFFFHTGQSNMSNDRMLVSQMVRDSETRPPIVVKNLSQEALSDSFYCFIKEVPSRNWNMFMRTHLTDNEIDKATFDYPKDTEEQYYQMLINWKNKFGNEESIIKLLDSLWNIGLKRPHENIVNYLISRDIITIQEAKV